MSSVAPGAADAGRNRSALTDGPQNQRGDSIESFFTLSLKCTVGGRVWTGNLNNKINTFRHICKDKQKRGTHCMKLERCNVLMAWCESVTWNPMTLPFCQRDELTDGLSSGRAYCLWSRKSLLDLKERLWERWLQPQQLLKLPLWGLWITKASWGKRCRAARLSEVGYIWRQKLTTFFYAERTDHCSFRLFHQLFNRISASTQFLGFSSILLIFGCKAHFLVYRSFIKPALLP